MGKKKTTKLSPFINKQPKPVKSDLKWNQWHQFSFLFHVALKKKPQLTITDQMLALEQRNKSSAKMLSINIQSIFLSTIIKISSQNLTAVGKKIQEKRKVLEVFHNLGVPATRFKVKGCCRLTVCIHLLFFPDIHQTKDFRGET